MRINELTRSVDVNVETIPYYQRIGLLELPEKPHGGMRSYSDEDLQRLRFICRAQTAVLTNNAARIAVRASRNSLL